MIVNLIIKTSIIKFKVITEEAFVKITALFSEFQREMAADFSGHTVQSLYEIRTGDQMYSGPSFEEFEKQYRRNYKADHLRLVIEASDPKLQVNPVRARIALVFDRVQESNLSVLGVSNNWVNGVFIRYNEILRNIPTRNAILHSPLLEMVVQLLAVFVMAVFAIYAANAVASRVTIKFSEVYVFVIIFLLLSNLWGYVGRGLISIRNAYYPVVDIIRAPRNRILLAVVSFLLLTAAAWAIDYFLNLFLVGANR